MGNHAKLSPSSAKRWINCPGSVALSQKAPPQPASQAAAEGTVAHSIAEEYVTGKTDLLALMEKIGTVVKQEGFGIEITEEMIDGAVEYTEVIATDRRALEEDRKKATPIVGKAEVRLCASSVDAELWGTADYLMYRKGDVLIVNDYKFGKGVIVDPEENEQAMIYAIAAMDGEAGWAYDTVKIRIIQPRGAHIDGSVREWVAPIARLRAFANALRVTHVPATRDPKAVVVEGEWCRWCPAQAFCPVKYGSVQKQAQIDFEIVPTAAQIPSLPDIRLMSVNDLAKAARYKKRINEWFSAVDDVIRERLSAGETVPGWKLVDGRSNRKWISEEEVVKEYDTILGARLFEKKLLSPAKLEKMLGGKKGSVDHLTFKPEAGKTVAEDNDPRPVAKSQAAMDFEVVDAAPAGSKIIEKYGASIPASEFMASACEMCDLLGVCDEHKTLNGVKRIWA